MDYPNRKAKPKRKEPELRLAEYSAPCGEEYPWRTFDQGLPELDGARLELRPPRGHMH